MMLGSPKYFNPYIYATNYMTTIVQVYYVSSTDNQRYRRFELKVFSIRKMMYHKIELHMNVCKRVCLFVFYVCICACVFKYVFIKGAVRCVRRFVDCCAGCPLCGPFDRLIVNHSLSARCATVK